MEAVGERQGVLKAHAGLEGPSSPLAWCGLEAEAARAEEGLPRDWRGGGILLSSCLSGVRTSPWRGRGLPFLRGDPQPGRCWANPGALGQAAVPWERGAFSPPRGSRPCSERGKRGWLGGSSSLEASGVLKL